MKIAITSTGTDLAAKVDPRFGRSRFFLIVETETSEVKAIENPHAAAGGGAGPQSAQIIAREGAEAILTGNCGPNAYRTLEAAGIKVIVGVGGTVGDALAQFKTGDLAPTDAPNVQNHFGTGGATQPGQTGA